jgi:hypothetical protein
MYINIVTTLFSYARIYHISKKSRSFGACNFARRYEEEMSEQQVHSPLSPTGECKMCDYNGFLVGMNNTLMFYLVLTQAICEYGYILVGRTFFKEHIGYIGIYRD